MSDWEPIGQLAPIWKPKKIGETIEGIVSRVYEGNFGTTADVETKKGRITLPAHKNLIQAITEMEKGDEIKIEYVGKGETKKGMKFEKYDVRRRRAKSGPQ